MRTTDSAATHFSRGNALQQSRRFAEAIESYDRALTIDPNHADAHANRGSACIILGRLAEAEAEFLRAIALDQTSFEANYNLANLMRASGRFAEAEPHYRRVLELQPEMFQAHDNLGIMLGKLGRYEEAASHFQRIAELRPGFDDPFVNLGHVLRMAGRAEEAEAACRRALALASHNAKSYLNLGLALEDLGRLDEALACFREANARKPDFWKAILSEGLLHLRRGDFALGLDKYEARWHAGELAPRGFEQEYWAGQPLVGRRILLYAEQGFGDTIQMLRYVPLVAKAGAASITLEVQKELLALTMRLGGSANVIARGERLPSFDLHCPLLSLPRAFGTRVDSIPSRVPYLFAAPERIADWRQRLNNDATLKIGIAWAGSPLHRMDRLRSLPLTALTPLFDAPDTRWFSLQVGPRTAELGELRHNGLTDVSAMLTDFGETAAAIANLDLILSVDTAVAHLAGALGKPIWVMLPFASDWRWLLGRSDSPWYPNMRLFRQSRPGDWSGVVSAICAAFQDLRSLAASPDRRTTLAN
jgi:tetratricopeptide (TPR) repeat protein